MKQKIIVILISVIFFGCKKDGSNAISNSIFGIYSEDGNTGRWWEYLLTTTFTKVSHGIANYTEIITDYNSIYPSFTIIFDSVIFFENNSFNIDQIVKSRD